MDEADFNQLIEGRGRLWQCAAGRILGNAADADEAVQRALLAAWEHRAEFRSEAALSSWIFRIAVNQAYNLLRKRRRDGRKDAAYAELHAGDAEEDTANEAKIEALNRAIAELPAPYRESVEFLIAGKLDYAWAAAELGCSVNTLYWRMNKAKKLLKKELERS